jgi:hypothetical protein
VRSHARELVVPPAAEKDPNSREMIRAWIADKALHCSLNVGTWAEREAIGWGILLSDVARHVADALEKSEGKDKGQFLDEVKRVFNDELEAPSAETEGSFVS